MWNFAPAGGKEIAQWIKNKSLQMNVPQRVASASGWLILVVLGRSTLPRVTVSLSQGFWVRSLPVDHLLLKIHERTCFVVFLFACFLCFILIFTVREKTMLFQLGNKYPKVNPLEFNYCVNYSQHLLPPKMSSTIFL